LDIFYVFALFGCRCFYHFRDDLVLRYFLEAVNRDGFGDHGYNGNRLVFIVLYCQANSFQWFWSNGRIGRIVLEDFGIEKVLVYGAFRVKDGSENPFSKVMRKRLQRTA
jgi:hypothetical protein